MSRAAIVLVAVVALLEGCSGIRVVRDGKIDPAAAERIETKLATVRGLRLPRRVPILIVSREEARVMLERSLRRTREPESLQALTRAWARVGLVDADADLAAAQVDFWVDHTGGFYDPVDERVVLVDHGFDDDVVARALGGALRPGIAGELVLARELQHAVQDGHFGIDLERSAIGADDAELARQAAYTGDAILTAAAVVRGGLSTWGMSGVIRDLEGAAARVQGEAGTPELIRDAATFRWAAGTNFVSWAYESRQFDGVNLVLGNPPRSSEQVLHPEKYFVTPEYPLAVHIGALAPYVKDAWDMLSDETLGELGISILLRRHVAADRAAAAAAGWDGDRMVALARDGDVAVVWLSTWSSEDDAEEFLKGYLEVLAKRGVPVAPGEGDGRVLEAGGVDPAWLERRGNKVLVVLGPLDPDLAGFADRAWRRSSFEAGAPWTPLELAGAPGPWWAATSYIHGSEK